MAGFFKKRSAAPGPNKNEAKVMRGRESAAQARSTASLASRFPNVSRLSIHLEFVSNHGALLGDETRSFGAQDGCKFVAPCPGQCGVGSFDLNAKIEAVLGSHQSKAEASGTCQEPLYAGSPDLCGTILKCRIDASYIEA
jgi:hypothetical protein